MPKNKTTLMILLLSIILLITTAFVSCSEPILIVSADSPTIAPNGGKIASTDTITLTTATDGAAIYYTLDGTTPTASSTEYTAPFTLNDDGTIVKAIAVHTDMLDSAVATSMAFSFKVAAGSPVIAPNGGKIASTDTITLTTATDGATIYYTLNGDEPTASSTEYTAPFTLTDDGTIIKAIAVHADMVDSAVTTSPAFSFKVAAGSPTIAPNGGKIASTDTITLTTATDGAAIYYTLDETTPTPSSTLYTAPFTLDSASDIVKAITVHADYLDSAVNTSEAFIFKVPAESPVIAPNGGTIASTNTITLTTATDGATIYYTLNGDEPTASSTEYIVPFTLTVDGTIVKAIAVHADTLDSVVATSEAFTFDVSADKPTSSLSVGTYIGRQLVTLSSTTTEATIYYTLDGSDPKTTANTQYTVPFYIYPGTTSGDITLKAYASKDSYANSDITTMAYTMTVPDIGDEGQAGKVFHDKGSYRDGWRFLEAAPDDINGGQGYTFGYYRKSPEGPNMKAGTSDGVGTGQANTDALVEAMGTAAYTGETGTETTAEYAAKLCADYVIGAYTDWFLPSYDEIDRMRDAYSLLDNLDSSTQYWSSSEQARSANLAFYMEQFSSGTIGNTDRNSTYKVRPVRAF